MARRCWVDSGGDIGVVAVSGGGMLCEVCDLLSPFGLLPLTTQISNGVVVSDVHLSSKFNSELATGCVCGDVC